jgi:hypothetical protein
VLADGLSLASTYSMHEKRRNNLLYDFEFSHEGYPTIQTSRSQRFCIFLSCQDRKRPPGGLVASCDRFSSFAQARQQL